MQHLFSTALVALILSLGGCSASSSSEGDERRAQAKEIYDEAIVIHDEVMPRMDEMMQLRQQLQTRADSLYQADSIDYGYIVDDMRAAADRLQKADEGMMQWMRSLEKVPEAIADTTELVAVQRRQKDEIEKVKQQMETGIEEANELLNGL